MQPAKAKTRLAAFLHVAVLAVPVGLAAVLAVFPIHSDDAFFHVAVGRWILAAGQLPQHNPFSYADDGATWIHHEWLPEIGMAWLADHAGVGALIVAKAVLVAAAFATMMATLRSSGVAPALAVALGCLAAWGCAFRYYERPYLFSILALAGTTWALLRWQATGDRRARLVAVVLPVAAVQLHAGAIDGVLLWLAFAVGHTLQARLHQPGRLPPAHIWGASALVVGLLVAGLALLAPSGLQALGVPLALSGNGYWHEHVAEFRPLRFDAEALPQWLLVAVACAGLLRAIQMRRMFEAFAIGGFAVLAVQHARMIWPMSVVAMPLTAGLFEDVVRPHLGRRSLHLALSGVALLCAIGAVREQHARFGLGFGPRVIDQERHPLAMLRLGASLPGEALVSDGLAGTWLWLHFPTQAAVSHPERTHGRKGVLVNNCFECYREATYRDVYQRIRYGDKDWKQLSERYGIRTFVLKYTTQGERRFQAGRPNLRQLLFADPSFVLVDFDDGAEVFALRSSLPPGTATLDGFPVDPDSGAARPGAPTAAIRRALADHAMRHPESARSLGFLAQLERQLGHIDEMHAATAERLRRKQPRGLQ